MKLNTYALLASFLLIPATMNPMRAQLKRGLYKACKAINIALPALPIAAGAGILVYSQVTQTEPLFDEDPKIKKSPDAPEIVEAFAHENMKAIGVNKPSLQTKQYSRFASYKDDILLIEDCQHASDKDLSITSLLKKRQSNSLTPQEIEKLNLYRAIIQHEGTHLKNHDSRNTSSIQYAALCAANYLPLYNFYQSKILKKNVPITIAPSAIRSLALISSGLGKLIMTPLIMSAYSLYTEQRADDGISDDIDVLQAAANEFRKKAYEEDNDSGAMVSPIRRKIENFFSTIREGHPSNTQRAEKFEQRIAKLKEQDAQKSAANNKS